MTNAWPDRRILDGMMKNDVARPENFVILRIFREHGVRTFSYQVPDTHVTRQHVFDTAEYTACLQLHLFIRIKHCSINIYDFPLI